MHRDLRLPAVRADDQGSAAALGSPGPGAGTGAGPDRARYVHVTGRCFGKSHSRPGDPRGVSQRMAGPEKAEGPDPPSGSVRLGRLSSASFAVFGGGDDRRSSPCAHDAVRATCHETGYRAALPIVSSPTASSSRFPPKGHRCHRQTAATGRTQSAATRRMDPVKARIRVVSDHLRGRPA